MSNHSEICWQGCPTNCAKIEKSCRRVPSRLPSLIIIFYGLLKMTTGSNVPDSASMYIHVCIPFNFTTVFNTKTLITEVYDILLEQHQELFKAIAKSVTDVSLATIKSSLEDFRDIIKALPPNIGDLDTTQTKTLYCHWHFHCS
jgi:hypothetical protein